jgi:hypothetical protein
MGHLRTAVGSPSLTRVMPLGAAASSNESSGGLSDGGRNSGGIAAGGAEKWGEIGATETPLPSRKLTGPLAPNLLPLMSYPIEKLRLSGMLIAGHTCKNTA